MEQSELLERLVRILEELDLSYVVTGSMASIFYGEPRFTNDIDVVVALTPGTVAKFCAAFPSDEYYVSEDAARRAVFRRGQFNILVPGSGLKVDVIVPKDSPFDRSRFARRKWIEPIPGLRAVFASAEDVVVKKMESYKAGSSEKHLRDIAGILRVMGDQLDRIYIADWANRLDLVELWNDLVTEDAGQTDRLGPDANDR